MKHVIVNETLTQISFGDLCARALGRLMPFDPLTCLGDNSRGFHDKVSGTFVLTQKEFDRISSLTEQAQE